MLIESIKDTLRELRLPHPPFWLVSLAVVAVVGTWLPLAYVARARTARSPLPPIHIFQDMDNQPRPKAQHPSPVFADGRSMRPVIPGTVAREGILDDEHYTRGYVVNPNGRNDKPEAVYFEGFPERVTVDGWLLDRGQRQFNIMCSHCHGADGRGRGLVNERALELVQAGALNSSLPRTEWVQVANLLEVQADGPDAGQLKFGSSLYPEGKLFNTITQGLNNMPALGSQIPVEDRWAIVAYVRALQASSSAEVAGSEKPQTQPLQQDESLNPKLETEHPSSGS